MVLGASWWSVIHPTELIRASSYGQQCRYHWKKNLQQLLDLLTSSIVVHPPVNSGESEEKPVGVKCRATMPFFLFCLFGFLFFPPLASLYFIFTWSCPKHSFQGFHFRHAGRDGAEFQLARQEPSVAAPQRCYLVLCQVPESQAGKYQA